MYRVKINMVELSKREREEEKGDLDYDVFTIELHEIRKFIK